MIRKLVVVLNLLLLISLIALPTHAQSGEPPQQTVYVVQRGETLFSIAQRHGLTVDAVAHANGIADPRHVYVGQQLVIPGGQSETPAQATVSHVVQPGDTLSSIARRYRTTWQTLVQVNSLLSPNTIYAGQVIQVPINSPLGTSESASGSAAGGRIHVVRPRETPSRIALRYGISSWTLAALNDVENPALIHAGQELTVPGQGAGLLPAPFASVNVHPLPVSQGTTTVVAVHTTEPVTLEGRIFGQQVRFARASDAYYGLIGIHVFTEPGLYELELTAVDTEGQSTMVTTGVIVEAGRFGYEQINVSGSRNSLLDPAVIAADRERLDAIRYTFTQGKQWEGFFRRPCVGNVTSYFGSHRSYNGSPYTSFHSGVDFRAPRGTPVYAPAGGTVVFNGPLALWGNTVAVDHGWGLLTGYGHLSTVEVQVGQPVAQGDLIGRVGNTGLSTGAHLHWEVWVGGVSVNGLQWLEQFYPWPEPEGLAIGG